MIVYQLVNGYKRLDEVEAIILAGSGASGRKDNYSDIDIDVIVSTDIDLAKRKHIIDKLADSMEVGNDYWGAGDEFVLRNSNVQVDIAYFSLSWLEGQIENILVNNVACTGYTTCFWHNIKNAIIVYDKSGKFTELQEKSKVDYPERLKENILKKNYPILRDAFSSYYNQIDKAIKRNDLVSINHRIAAFLASYFDIIFAINEMPHPGEKKLMDIVENKCDKKPINFRKDIENLLKDDKDNILTNLNIIVDNLDLLLSELGIQ